MKLGAVRRSQELLTRQWELRMRRQDRKRSGVIQVKQLTAVSVCCDQLFIALPYVISWSTADSVRVWVAVTFSDGGEAGVCVLPVCLCAHLTIMDVQVSETLVHPNITRVLQTQVSTVSTSPSTRLAIIFVHLNFN